MNKRLTTDEFIKNPKKFMVKNMTILKLII